MADRRELALGGALRGLRTLPSPPISLVAQPNRGGAVAPARPRPRKGPTVTTADPSAARAIIYAAKSSPDDRDSIPDQIAACRSRIEAEGSRDLAGVFSDEAK